MTTSSLGGLCRLLGRLTIGLGGRRLALVTRLWLAVSRLNCCGWLRLVSTCGWRRGGLSCGSCLVCGLLGTCLFGFGSLLLVGSCLLLFFVGLEGSLGFGLGLSGFLQLLVGIVEGSLEFGLLSRGFLNFLRSLGSGSLLIGHFSAGGSWLGGFLGSLSSLRCCRLSSILRGLLGCILGLVSCRFGSFFCCFASLWCSRLSSILGSLLGLSISGLGVSRLGTSGLGISGLGISWLGVSWLGTSGLGISWLGISGLGISGLGISGLGVSGLGVSWLGVSGLGISWLGISSRFWCLHREWISGCSSSGLSLSVLGAKLAHGANEGLHLAIGTSQGTRGWLRDKAVYR